MAPYFNQLKHIIVAVLATTRMEKTRTSRVPRRTDQTDVQQPGLQSVFKPCTIPHVLNIFRHRVPKPAVNVVLNITVAVFCYKQ